QVLQSDITYFYVNDRFYYIVFIMDVYTRKILGYNLGDNLRTECNIKALKMALKKIPKQFLNQLIQHSESGAQYGRPKYTQRLRHCGISSSMGKIAHDNAYVERVNGTSKNEDLKRAHTPEFKTLKSETRKEVNNYNAERLHLAFENKD